jgi:predicted membrane channel-forming protein YqfA (hemolysin III family)
MANDPAFGITARNQSVCSAIIMLACGVVQFFYKKQMVFGLLNINIIGTLSIIFSVIILLLEFPLTRYLTFPQYIKSVLYLVFSIPMYFSGCTTTGGVFLNVGSIFYIVSALKRENNFLLKKK